MKTAVIAGGTGLIGKELLNLLLASNQYHRVVAITRSPLPMQDPKLKNIVVDFHELETALEDVNADDVFCCLGTTMAKAGSKEKFYEVDYKFPYALGQATLKKGAKKFLLVTALGADKYSAIYYNRVKGDVEEALSGIGFQALHIFRPSLLLGPRNEPRAGERMGKVFSQVFGFLVPAKYKAIEGVKVSRAMLYFASADEKGFFIHASRDLQKF